MPFISGAIAAIGSAITAVTAWAGTLGVIGKAVLSFGLSMGLSALAGALGQKQPAAKPGEIAATLQVGGDIPRQAAFGLVGLKGQLVFTATAGVSDERLLQIFLQSDGWCDGLAGVWFSGKRHELVPMTPDNGAVAKWSVPAFGDTGFGDPRAQIWFYDGRPGQAANPRPAAFAPDLADPTDRFAGMAYVMVELINNGDTFDSIPDLLFELRGYRCHDPRKDPAYGGTGTHVAGDPATWEWTENPALFVWNYLRGIESEDVAFMGLGSPDYDLLVETFVDAANICDEPVPLEAGGSEARYRASTVILAGDTDHRAALAPLVQAMAGYLIERGGAFGLVAGAAQLPVVTITDDDIDWSRGVKWSGSKSRTERTNEVHGQYVDPTAQWQANSYPAITSAVYSGEDGERLAVKLDFGSITSVTQAQRAARIRMRETRRQASGSATLGMHLLWLEPGDWVRWNSAKFSQNRLYRLVSRDLNPDDTSTVQLQEVGNEIYSWNSGDEQPYAPAPTPDPGPPLPSTVTNFTVQPEVISGTDGSTRPVLRLTWDPIADERVIAVIIEYRPVGSVAATRVRDDSPWDGEFILDQPPTGLDYEFRASIATQPARPVTWTPWVSIETLRGDRWLVDVPDLLDRFRKEHEWYPVLHPDLLALSWQTAMQALSADGRAEASIRRVEEVNVSQTEARATLAQQTLTRFEANEGTSTLMQQSISTLTSAQATLTAQVNANTSGLSSLSGTVTTHSGAITSLNDAVAVHTTQIAAKAEQSALTAVQGTVTSQGLAIADLAANKASVSYAVAIEAKANAATAGGQIDFAAGVGPGGANSRIRLRGWTDAGGTKTDAGLMIDIIGGVGRVSIVGSQFVFVDNSGNNPLSVFEYSGGRWRLKGDVAVDGNLSVENGTITVEKAAASARSKLAYVEKLTPTYLIQPAVNAWYDVLVLDITPANATANVTIDVYLFGRADLPDNSPANGCNYVARLFRRKGGVDTPIGPVFSRWIGTADQMFPALSDNPGAGAVQYVLRHGTSAYSGGGPPVLVPVIGTEQASIRAYVSEF